MEAVVKYQAKRATARRPWLSCEVLRGSQPADRLSRNRGIRAWRHVVDGLDVEVGLVAAEHRVRTQRELSAVEAALGHARRAAQIAESQHQRGGGISVNLQPINHVARRGERDDFARHRRRSRGVVRDLRHPRKSA